MSSDQVAVVPAVPGRAARRSVEEWEAVLGRQIRELRLRLGRTQAELADAANLDRSTLKRIERGEGGTVRSLVQVARALGREDWLAAFAPVPTVSPMQLLREQQRAEGERHRRARVRPRRSS
jgi:transcriptional regulator with XRE-family HTH domain